jgi:hypothetical protein
MPRRAPRPCLALFALVVAGLMAACGTSKPASPPGTAAAPEVAVTGYYHALSLHRFPAASAYLAPATRSFVTGSLDSPEKNLVSLDHLKVNASQPVSTASLPGLPSGVVVGDYDSFAQVSTEYNATFRQVITARSGRQIKFLYLGRLRSNAQWQILAIGSGP